MKSIQDLKKLATIPGPCLTILEPLRDPVVHRTKASEMLLNAAQEADRLLREKGFGEEDREHFLAPIRNFAANTDFAGRSGGVAVFRSPGFTQATFWPDELAPKVTLAEEFQVLPLLAGLTAERNYWLLALSINRIHLFRGEGTRFSEFTLPADLPRSLADFMGFDKPDHDLEGRSAKGPSSGAGFGVRFGTSSVPETEAAHLHDFFKLIAHTIHPIMGRDGAGDPLMLAAVPRELALYRVVNTYSPMVEEAIHGSPDALGFERLHRTALELIAAHNGKTGKAAVGQLEAAAGRKLLLTDPLAIASAAAAGQVAQIFIQPGIGGDKSNEAVVNRAVLAVIATSGTVSWAPEGLDGFGQNGVAAILRYAASGSPGEPELATAIL